MERISPAVTLPIVTATSDLCSNLFACALMILLSVKQWYRAIISFGRSNTESNRTRHGMVLVVPSCSTEKTELHANSGSHLEVSGVHTLNI